MARQPRIPDQDEARVARLVAVRDALEISGRALARELEVDDAAMRRWLARREPPPLPSHPIWTRLDALVERRRAALDGLAHAALP